MPCAHLRLRESASMPSNSVWLQIRLLQSLGHFSQYSGARDSSHIVVTLIFSQQMVLHSKSLTFTVMHLADASIQSDLYCIQAIHFLSVCHYLNYQKHVTLVYSFFHNTNKGFHLNKHTLSLIKHNLNNCNWQNYTMFVFIKCLYKIRMTHSTV